MEILLLVFTSQMKIYSVLKGKIFEILTLPCVAAFLAGMS